MRGMIRRAARPFLASTVVALAIGLSLGSSGDDDDTCADITDCAACANALGSCGWCSSRGTCVDVVTDSSGAIRADDCPLAPPVTYDGYCAVTEICDGGLCVEVIKAAFTEQPCDGAPDQDCTYANAFFTVTHDDENVLGLGDDDVTMLIDNREVGVEGTKDLASSNALLVKLLLDASYSITESESGEQVKESALTFVEGLPAQAKVAVASFASEETVPTYLCADGSSGSSSGFFHSRAEGYAAVNQQYTPHPALTSAAQTKIFDAVANMARTEPNGATAYAPEVMVVFTDGADTASETYDRATSVRSVIDETVVYAVGLGDAVDTEALTALADGRVALAENPAELDAAFEDIANEIAAIYQLRILVSEGKDSADADLTINHGGGSVTASFGINSTTVDTGGGTITGDQCR